MRLLTYYLYILNLNGDQRERPTLVREVMGKISTSSLMYRTVCTVRYFTRISVLQVSTETIIFV